jgi:excisionase family DNA binding protein
MSDLDEAAGVVARNLFEKFIWPQMRDHLRALLRECSSCAPAPAESRSEPKQWLSPKEAAKLVGVTTPTVRGWVRAGLLSAERLGLDGRLLRIDRCVLDTFIRGRGASEQTLVTSVKSRVEEILVREGQKSAAISDRKEQGSGRRSLRKGGR